MSADVAIDQFVVSKAKHDRLRANWIILTEPFRDTFETIFTYPDIAKVWRMSCLLNQSEVLVRQVTALQQNRFRCAVFASTFLARNQALSLPAAVAAVEAAQGDS